MHRILHATPAILVLTTVLLWVASPASAHDGEELEIDGHFSGTWLDPARSGEGWVIQVLDDGQAFVVWFTYPEPGAKAGKQFWITGVGRIVDDQIVIDEALSLSGAGFGASFDPDQIVREIWGSFTITFGDCGVAAVEFNGPDAFGTGVYPLERLSTIRGLECDSPELEVLPGLAAQVATGAWFNPDRAGEGWLLEDLGDGIGLAFWFTFTPDGDPAWLIGTGEFAEDGLFVDEAVITTGTRFGDTFDPDAVIRSVWGWLQFEFYDCASGRLTYHSDVSGYGAGAIDMTRLTSLNELECAPFPDAPLTHGAWQTLLPPMPTARAELSGAGVDGRAYLVAGFGGSSRLESFDPVTSTWTRHPSIPRGRNHSMAVGYRHELYVFGGFLAEIFGREEASAYAFDTLTDQWRRLADLPTPKASTGSAVEISGKIYLVGGEPAGSLVYDPRTDTYETFAEPPGGFDHSHAVGFRGEVWLMGGLPPGGETAEVHIYNPFRDEWRRGPSLNNPRSGFAATVFNGRIVISGGEIRGSVPRRTLDSMEVYDHIAGTWQEGPPMPQSLHGLVGVGIDNRFYLFGGAPIAGSGQSAGVSFVYDP